MQKSFAFYLSALTFLLLALSAASCHMNPDTQTAGQEYLQGEWQQDSVPMQKKLLNYSLYHFRFSCDSFFISIRSFSKINYGSDSCMKAGHWTEYTRGHYEQRNDTLFLKGQFCNPDFSIKDNPASCFRSGVYEDFFKVVKKTDSLIQLSSISNVIPINARLIKRNTCHIKTL